MRRFSKILALVLALLFVVGCLSACGGSLSEEEKAAVGYYALISYSMSGFEVDAGDGHLDLKDNGKADFIVEGEGGTVKWTLENGTITISDSESSYSGTVDGDSIQLEMEGMLLQFERQN